MLHLRALGARAAAQLGGGAGRCTTSLAASGPAAALGEQAGGAGGRWGDYSKALSRLGFGGPLGTSRDDEQPSKAAGAKGLHTGGLGGRPRQLGVWRCRRQAPPPPRASTAAGSRPCHPYHAATNAG